MKAFVVVACWNYEDEEILGIYADRQAAEDRAAKARAEQTVFGPDAVTVSEMEVIQ